MTLSYSSQSQRGVTLIELMIAIAVSFIVLIVIASVYLSSKQTYRVSDALARYQENMRYAAEVLSHDIRLAGHIGCSKSSTITNRSSATPNDNVWYAMTEAIRGYDDNTATLPTGLSAGERVVGDVVKVQFAAPTAHRLSSAMASPSAAVTVTASASDFAVNDVAMIQNCGSVDTFQVTSVSASAGSATLGHSTTSNSSGNFTRSYGTDAEVSRMVNRIYYIGQLADGRRALMRKTLSSTVIPPGLNTEELADGVEDMQILYGLDLDRNGVIDRYVRADTIPAAANWQDVLSARICLQFVSRDSNLTTSQQTYYDCAGNSVTAPDRALRQTFTTTISLRNRNP